MRTDVLNRIKETLRKVIPAGGTVSKNVIDSIDPSISMHDFRVSRNPQRTNIIFDIVVPFGYPIPDEVLKKKIRDGIFEIKSNCYANITVDKSYVL